ncbi:MAG: DUF4339 domain-containing protein, partial [Thermoguttaceae bacterium]|nr:DUF4339 domain-containing protein [Thermoguttaceae bacterium]
MRDDSADVATSSVMNSFSDAPYESFKTAQGPAGDDSSPFSGATFAQASPPQAPNFDAVDPEGLLLVQNCVWHIKTSDGQHQYGPVTGAELRQWIQENRIEPEMFVFRSGWQEWNKAGAVFRLDDRFTTSAVRGESGVRPMGDDFAGLANNAVAVKSYSRGAQKSNISS